MFQLMEPFNPLNHNPEQSGGQLPVGRHKVVIDGGEIKPTANNDGGMLILNLLVIEGEAAGSRGVYRLNLYNKSTDAVRIAQQQFSAVCHVIGVFQLGANGDDASALFNIPFIVDVQTQKGEPKYTEIKRVYDINGNEPQKRESSQAQQPAQAPAQGGFSVQQAPAAAAPVGNQWGAPQAQQPAQAAPVANKPAWATPKQ